MDRQLQRQSSMDSNKEKRQNIKSSLEQQHQLNKQKFQDPFFIQIGEAGTETSNLKIVKQKKKVDDNETEARPGSQGMNQRRLLDSSQRMNSSANQRTSSITLRKGPGQVVQEAKEEDEQSPKKGGRAPSPTRNNYSRTTSLPKGQKKDGNGTISESENFEKISDDASTIKTLPQLVKLDINLDTLKNFLEDIQEAINDHAKQLGVVQSDMKKKANEKTISHYFLKISEGLHKECGERPHAFRLEHESQNFLSDNFQTEDSVLLKRQSEKLQEKLEIIGLNIINMNKYKTLTDDRLERLERIIPKCFTIDQFREESQQQEQRTLTYINNQLGTFQENLNGYKKELNEALTFFEKKVNDNQSETLWRIKDCEELLKSRVSDKFVIDAIKSIEDKLSKTMAYNDEKQIERLEKSFKELGIRVVQTNQFFQEKFDDLRKIISIYDNKIQNLATNDKLISVQTGYRDMKYNFEREMEMLQEHVKETKDKIGELNKRFSNLELATMSLANGGDFTYHTANNNNQNQSNQGTSRNQFQTQSNSDKLKQNQQNNNIHNNNNRNKSPNAKEKIDPSQFQASSPTAQNFSPIARKRQGRAADAAFAAEIDKRFQIYEQQMDSVEMKFDSLKRQMDDKVSRDDVRKLTSDKISKEDLDNIIPNEEITQEKMKYLVREEIEMLWGKLNEQFKQVDNKMIRLRAEIDIHSIQRQLERKANEDQVRSDFNNHEFKIGTLDRNIIRMASDFETFQLAITKIHGAIVELQEANRDVLLGKKTNNCLSCGKGGDTGQTVKGKDGRIYKASENQQAKLHQDDSVLIGGQYQNYDQQNPTAGQQLQMNQSGYDLNANQQEFFKMRASNSFYDSGLGVYDNQSINAQNLPQLHNKKSSIHANNAIIKSIAQNSGLNISGTGNANSNTSLAQNNNNSSFQQSRKKLPFGFQVQQEKKELLKIQPRGKSSQNMKRAQSNRMHEGQRPDSAHVRDGNYNFNSTFEQ